MRMEVLWRQLVATGTEHMILTVDDDIHADVHADGMAVGEVDSTAYRVRYELDCDGLWHVEQLTVHDLLNHRSITLARLQHDRWSDGEGHEREELAGCTDVDLMITPFTNTLPIRRLGLKVGETKEIAVVYVALPDLVTTKVEQRYSCLSLDQNEGIYLYQNLKNDFAAQLKVDGDRLVVDYPNIFVMDAKRRLAGD